MQQQEDAHASAARVAFDYCFAELPLARAYELSAEGTDQRGEGKMSKETDLTYGDVQLEALERALVAATLPADGVFYDLGSGSGRGVIAAALCSGLRLAVGVEILQPLHEAALGPLERFLRLRDALLAGERPDGVEVLTALEPGRLAKRVELRCGDLFDVDISGADVVFCCCVTWSRAILQRLAAKLAAELPEGARVVSVGQRLPEVVDRGAKAGAIQFEVLWKEWAKCDWGDEAFVVHRAQRLGELAARRHRKKARAAAGAVQH
eukprot:1349122-Prymnesium_polylepis.1